MRLHRVAVLIPLTKGLLCASVGGAALAYSFVVSGSGAGSVALALTFFSIPWLVQAAGYFVAAFLLSRAWVVWRVPGVLLDALLSVVIAWALIEAGSVQSAPSPAVQPQFGNWPLVIGTAIAGIWVAAWLPVAVGAIRSVKVRSVKD